MHYNYFVKQSHGDMSPPLYKIFGMHLLAGEHVSYYVWAMIWIAAAAAMRPPCTFALPGPGDRPAPVTCIIGAMAEEIRPIRAELRGAVETQILGISFTSGTLRGRRVVVAESGVGKVNAAMTATLAVEHFHPREIIFTGTAGRLSPTLMPGDVVVGTRMVQHDLGWSAPGGFIPAGVINPADGKRNPVFFDADPSLVDAVERASRLVELSPPAGGAPGRNPVVVKGTIATGDTFISSAARGAEIRKQFAADVVEMEGGAGAQICRQSGVPFVAIRAVSDTPGGHTTLALQPYSETACRNAAALAMKAVEILK